jgi:hypothetical protein
MVEPFAVGMQAATGKITPGDTAIVRRRSDRHHGGAGGAGRRLLAASPTWRNPSSTSPRSTRGSSVNIRDKKLADESTG